MQTVCIYTNRKLQDEVRTGKNGGHSDKKFQQKNDSIEAGLENGPMTTLGQLRVQNWTLGLLLTRTNNAPKTKERS